jgi:hypothetical protein
MIGLESQKLNRWRSKVLRREKIPLIFRPRSSVAHPAFQGDHSLARLSQPFRPIVVVKEIIFGVDPCEAFGDQRCEEIIG